MVLSPLVLVKQWYLRMEGLNYRGEREGTLLRKDYGIGTLFIVSQIIGYRTAHFSESPCSAGGKMLALAGMLSI